jgi:hypothetical protein
MIMLNLLAERQIPGQTVVYSYGDINGFQLDKEAKHT